MPSKSKKSRKIQNESRVPPQTQNWTNFLQHDIEARTSRNRTNAIILIALGGVVFYLGSSILTFLSSTAFILAILGVLAYFIPTMYISKKVIKKGRMPIVWRKFKITLLILFPYFVYVSIALALLILYAPETFLSLVTFALFSFFLMYLIICVFRIYIEEVTVKVLQKLLIKTISGGFSIRRISKWYDEIFNYTVIDCLKIETGMKVLPWESPRRR